MPPIIAITTSTDEDTDLNVLHSSKQNFGHHDADTLLVTGATGATAAEGRDDIDDGALDVEPLDKVAQGDMSNNAGMRQSNLFVDENAVNDSEDPFPSNQTSHSPPPCALLPRGLSLMHSSSPLEDVDLGMHTFDEFAIIDSQIDADEELARQLQEEENKKSTSKGKPKVAKSLVNSWLGEPLAWEVRSNSGTGFRDSVSEIGDSLASSFKKWGSGMSAAATNFFGEDLQMQVKRPSANCPRAQFPNAI